MKSIIAAFAVGGVALFCVFMFCAGMQDAFGENAGPVFISLATVPFVCFLMGKAILALTENTKATRKINEWVRK